MTRLREFILRMRLGALASRLYPGLDEALFNRRRDAEMRAEIDASLLLDVPLLSRPAGSGITHRPSHLVVVPQVGPHTETWRPAGGNFFYEIAQAAREYAGAGKVTIFAVEPDEPPREWHSRLTRFLIDTGATHLIVQVESDPNSSGDACTWDTFWAQLSIRWDGVLLGVVTDSSFKWITVNARRLGAISPAFVLVDICIPMDGTMRRGRPEVGPVNMPVSTQTLAEIDRLTGNLPKIHDVSFIGALYPYRIDLIQAIRDMGVEVAVNPHRADATTDFAESRTNLPTYVDYMAGLRQSNMTINFSRSSAGEFQQLKTRVLEATSMGCLILTDDIDRTGRFWTPGSEYGYFASLAELPELIVSLLADPAELAASQERAKTRARAINVTSFWGGIEEGLRKRGLQPFKDEAEA